MPKLTLYYSDGACSMVPHILLTHLSIPFTAVRMIATTPNDGKYPDSANLAAADGSISHAEYRATINAKGVVPSLKVEHGSSSSTDDVSALADAGWDLAAAASVAAGGPAAPAGSGGVVAITELPALLSYIAFLGGARPGSGGSTIMGRKGIEQAQVAEWLAWLAGTVQGVGYGSVFRAGRFTGMCGVEGAEAEAMREAEKKTGKILIDDSYHKVEKKLVAMAKAAKGIASGGGGGVYYAVGDGLTVVDVYLYLFWRWGTQIGIKMGELYPVWEKLARRIEGMEAVGKVLVAENKERMFKE